MSIKFNPLTGLYTAFVSHPDRTDILAQSSSRWITLVASGMIAIESLDVLDFTHLVSVGMR